MKVKSSIISHSLNANTKHIGGLIGSSVSLLASEIASNTKKPLILVNSSATHASIITSEIKYFYSKKNLVSHFRDRETLPYDNFSPHQSIISERLSVLHKLNYIKNGILITSESSLLQRLPPTNYTIINTINLTLEKKINRNNFIENILTIGYIRVPQVLDYGEFSIRGSLIDIFPMGSNQPIRIDFFDDEIESIRYFDIDTQISTLNISSVDILPANEIQLDKETIKSFRHYYRKFFEGDPIKSKLYKNICNGMVYGGIEYYLPLFFNNTSSIIDYFPNDAIVLLPSHFKSVLNRTWGVIKERYDTCNHNQEKPILRPNQAFFKPKEVLEKLEKFKIIEYNSNKIKQDTNSFNVSTKTTPVIKIQAQHKNASKGLQDFLNKNNGKILFVTESETNRKYIINFINELGYKIYATDSWQEFLSSRKNLLVSIAPIENSVILEQGKYSIISEKQLFGEKVQQKKYKRKKILDPEIIIRQLNDLEINSPIVHIEHGIGLYKGLITLANQKHTGEYLHLEYFGGDKLYVPVHALNLISRYSSSSENIVVNRLGSNQWKRIKRKAIQKIRDTAAELLDKYSQRAARKGHSFKWKNTDYQSFKHSCPFEETEDQINTIDQILDDLASEEPMDRIVCGDVGFGKTEAALRAALVVVLSGKQVCLLVPTTLLAQQHGQTFSNRFSDWPINIEVLSRFQSKKETEKIVSGIRKGLIDIVIGTHKLLHHTNDFFDIGLIIIDEEHRFGVRQKEAIRSLRNSIDILTLTATPIPRTLNMALGGIREISLITTPPSERIAIKTFVSEWDSIMVREACLREIQRGGQVYFIHNRVKSIKKIEETLKNLIPEAIIAVAHGQMPERELEKIMFDFYHQKSNILVCTTIIESGIDIPTANTIIINRADKLGLGQLHQLRGRVGRSYLQAYAYLITPSKSVMTKDAIKRLEAIDSLEDLGSGFILATHDLEIRGAGELLGEKQSGQIQEIGFSLYIELLNRAVDSIKNGKALNLDKPLYYGADINTHIIALLPEEYISDVHLRLTLYKRISNTKDRKELKNIKIELIDRFGILPNTAKNLFQITIIKQNAEQLNIQKIRTTTSGGYIRFNNNTEVDSLIITQLIKKENDTFFMRSENQLEFKLDLSKNKFFFQFFTNLFDILNGKKKL